MKKVYDFVKDFKNRYKSTIAFRLKKHSDVIDGYVNPNEKVKYAFACQKYPDYISTCVVALTDKRLLIGQKRVLWGSSYTQVTPDLYNDMKIYRGLFWGSIIIDTAKEEINLYYISNNALDEIETIVSEFMMKEKKKYGKKEE